MTGCVCSAGKAEEVRSCIPNSDERERWADQDSYGDLSLKGKFVGFTKPLVMGLERERRRSHLGF